MRTKVQVEGLTNAAESVGAMARPTNTTSRDKGGREEGDEVEGMLQKWAAGEQVLQPPVATPRERPGRERLKSMAGADGGRTATCDEQQGQTRQGETKERAVFQ